MSFREESQGRQNSSSNTTTTNTTDNEQRVSLASTSEGSTSGRQSNDRVEGQAQVIPELVQVGYFTSHTAILRGYGFKLGQTVGEGSYCRVRSAMDMAHPHRRLAAKIVNRNLASSDFVNRFLPREIEVLSWVRHPNIVRIHRIIDFRDYVYIFMDLATTDLLEYLRRHGPLPENLAKCYFRQILNAIGYLHRNDVAHRDLKCENVLLFPNHVVKLTDFGFSRMCKDKRTGRSILSDTYCGSAAYAAPEILSGTPYNPKMYDMWSLGIILFTMVIGNLPFDDSNPRKMLDNQRKKIMRFQSMIDDMITPSCTQLIRSILEPDVCKRAILTQVERHPWVRLRD